MSGAARPSLATAIVLVALVASAAAERVSVVFVDPQRFADVKDAAMASERGTRAILDERALPAGLVLEVRVTDVDLAGEFEPWRGPQFERVRFMREIHWPRIDLEFTLKDAEGRLVREGKRSLSDPNYLARSLRVSDDRLRYEKDVGKWLRRELAP
jgi:hypothetical protein